jgi:hypothetical protein
LSWRRAEFSGKEEKIGCAGQSLVMITGLDGVKAFNREDREGRPRRMRREALGKQGQNQNQDRS